MSVQNQRHFMSVMHGVCCPVPSRELAGCQIRKYMKYSLLLAAPRKTGEETPGQLRSKADEALLKKDTDTALSLLARAIKLEPDNERNYFKRANVLKRAGKASRAVEDLDIALRIKPGYGAALVMRARALLGIGRCAEAKRD